nr:tryptophan 7-halogenase [Desulforadius tongensis]
MGQDSDSVQQQWISKLQTRVKFKQHVDYFKIRNKYDRIVLADGSLNIPIQLNIYEPTFKGWVRGAYLTGNFEPHKAEFWLDREFAREGFGCLTPFNNKSASLVLQVSGITRQELHDYWNTFINKIGFKTVSTGYFETEFQTGRLKKHVVDNTVIVGQAGGFVEAIWSQGIYSSAVSGIEAARCIVQKEDYEKRIKHLVKTNERIYNLRQRLNGLDNNGLDLLLKMFKIPGVKQLAAAGSCSGIKLISRLITGISGKEDRENVF